MSLVQLLLPEKFWHYGSSSGLEVDEDSSSAASHPLPLAGAFTRPVKYILN